MKEKDFYRKLVALGFWDEIRVRIFWSIDEDGDVYLDEEGIEEEFQRRLNWVKEILE